MDTMKYSRCIECDRELYKSTMFELKGSFICWNCVRNHNGPGTYEFYADNCEDPDLTDLATCIILHHWSLVDSEDEIMINEGLGYCGRLRQYLLFEDDRGFITYSDHGTELAAQTEFESLFETGWGADENDAYIFSDGFRYSLSFEGKTLDVWGDDITLRRCIARVRLESMKTGYYPNLWVVSDHGNLTLTPY